MKGNDFKSRLRLLERRSLKNSANVGRAHKMGAAAPSPYTYGLRGGSTSKRKYIKVFLSTLHNYLLDGCGKSQELQFVKSDKCVT
jgi:hypothetical protein